MRSKEKRARLIDTLLNSPEYARNWAKYWRDVVMFHSTNENPAQVRFDLLEDWMSKQFQANAPWKASPMTYMFDGTQYVAVAAGSAILSFALVE